jgi:probable HAF family extracellular repeat protein
MIRPAPARRRAVLNVLGLSFSLGLASLVATGHATAAPATYRVVDLGANVTPLDVNDAGVVVGTRRLADGSAVGFRYQRRGGLQDLPGTSSAQAVDAAGRIVGSRPGGAFVFDGVVRPLPDGNLANGLNDVGQAAAGEPGVNPFRATPLPVNPALYDLDTDQWQVLDVARVYPRGTQQGVYADIYVLADVNDGGMAIGNKARTGLYGSSVFMVGPRFDGVTFLSIPNGRATALNNLGHFVGTADADTPYGLYGQAYWHDGSTQTQLGTLDGGLSSSAADVNEQDQVVGSSWLVQVPTSEVDPTKYHAFLWEAGTMTDLNTRIPTRGGWLLTGATGINERGDIVGTGLRNGVAHGFLLLRSRR